MELKDFIVTPIWLVLVYVTGFFVRRYVVDEVTCRYFFPALTVKIIGAITLGLVYQFYYEGGDTFVFHTYGSRHIWEAFMESPVVGLRLLTDSGNAAITGEYKYISKIYFFNDPASYLIVRIAAVLDLLTYSTYSATAVLFAVIGFIGSWMLFLTFYKQYPHLHFYFAIVIFFIPSIFFWSSGILKDTIMMACIGIATYQLYKIFFEYKITLSGLVLLFISFYAIIVVRKFILHAYVPAVIIWIFSNAFTFSRSYILKSILAPFILVLVMGLSYYAILKIGEKDSRYALSKIAETSKITAYDIRYWSGRKAGSGYDLGELDGTYTTMLKRAPQAINVSLFRPYLWEVKNPLMLLSALESIGILIFTGYVILKKRGLIFPALLKTNIIFTFIFSITFAFAVGVSTFNFGSLVRYKIPLISFFLISLILILDYKRNNRSKFMEHPDS